jgi:predicted Zn finger-like uncharacterized protein
MSIIVSPREPKGTTTSSQQSWPWSNAMAQKVVAGNQMDVRCKTCGTEYEFDAARIGPQGVKVKCTACESIFIVQSNSGTPSKTSEKEWLVRTSDDRLISFESLTTLQKWIIEGRIERDDEISKDGLSWKRMGNVQELEPFFSVFDRASALNDLMNTGTIGEHPIMVNGSEVLATTNPLRASRPASRPSSNRPTTRPHSQRSSGRPQSLIETQAVEAQQRRSSSLTNSTVPVPTSHPASFANQEAEVSTSPDHKATVGMSAVPRTNTASRPGSVPNFDTGFAGPAALNDIISDGPIEGVEGDEIVRRFERKNRLRRRVFAIACLGVGGLIGGAFFAIYGIPDSPLTKLKNWPTKSPSLSVPGQAHVEKARRLLEKDTLETIEAANQTYQQAIKAQPQNMELLAERALVLTIWADSLRRRARIEEQALTYAEEQSQSSESALRLYEELPPRAKQRSTKPAVLKSIDAAAVRASIDVARTKASKLTHNAFELLRDANDNGAPTIVTLRALANYYRVQRDPKASEYLKSAKAMARAAGQRDPFTMYIEAATLSANLATQSAGERDKIARLLEEVLTLRPTLVRARVLLARIFVAQKSNNFATENLKRVLAESPEHREAKALLAQLQKSSAKAAEPSAPMKAVAPQVPAPAAPTAKADPAKVILKSSTEKPAASKAKPSASKRVAAKSKRASSRSSGQSTYKYYLSQGKKLRRSNLPWKALHAYEKAAQIRKSSPAPYVGIGWCYLELGKPIAAQNQFKKASLVDPDSAEAQLGLGLALAAQGKIDAAMNNLEAVIDMAPRSRSARKARKTIREIRASE